MTEQLNILMLVDSFGIGGTETHVLSIARSLRAKGHNVIIGTSGGPLMQLLQTIDVQVVTMPFQSDNPLSSNYTTLLNQVRQLVEEHDIEVIHAHQIAGLKIAFQMSQELLIPVIFTAHGMFYPPRQLQSLIDGCEQVIAVSPPTAAWITNRIGFPRKQTTIIPNGIDIDHFKPANNSNNTFRDELGIQDKDFLVTLVSRIAWGKTRVIEDAIYAVEELNKTQNVRLAIVGSGPDSPFIHALAAMVNKRHDQDIILLTGALLDPVDAYRASDVVIGTARVALEAMSSGKPVIAAGNSGYFGLVTPENFSRAWQVYFGDHDFITTSSTVRLRSDIEFILNNPDTAETARKRRRLVAVHFGVDRVAQQVENVYYETLGLPFEAVEATTPITPDVSSKTTEARSRPSPNTKQRPVQVNSKVITGDTPLVSVVVPTYNRANLLNACLESLVKQNYRPLEIIVIDDHSTDNTKEVVNKWKKRVDSSTSGISMQYYFLPKNVGFAYAMSFGYFLANGEFIANQDSDDLSHPERIQQQVQFLQLNEDYGLVGSNYEVFTTDPNKTKKTYLVRYDNNIINSYRDGKHCVIFGSLLIRRKVVEKLGGLTTFMEGAEDYEYVARAIVQGFNVQNLRSVLYYYRDHTDQRSKDFYKVRSALTNHGLDGTEAVE